MSVKRVASFWTTLILVYPLQGYKHISMVLQISLYKCLSSGSLIQTVLSEIDPAHMLSLGLPSVLPLVPPSLPTSLPPSRHPEANSICDPA